MSDATHENELPNAAEPSLETLANDVPDLTVHAYANGGTNGTNGKNGGANGATNGGATAVLEEPATKPADEEAALPTDGTSNSVTTKSWTPKSTARKSRKELGLEVKRHLTRAGEDPFSTVEWELRTAAITGEDGKIVFEQKNCEIPKSWSQLATNVVVSKYFRGPLGSPIRETSVRQVIGRVADTFGRWGIEGGYFKTDEDAQAFRDELVYLLLHQYGSFNSPVWFNIGVSGAKQQASACFINSVHDNMESIMELAATEARLFKGGSGAGSNLSRIRSSKEHLSGGGVASGPVSFMRGWDAFAGAIKSGGTTRRAAKMVILDAQHPDIEEFITAKATEEKKAWALIDAGYNGGFNMPGGAYDSVDFQNANHSVRVTDEFMRAAENNAAWTTRAVTSGEPLGTHNAKEMLRKIAEATHICGDPGMQYDTTINDWHTSANTDRIFASNPCSEFVFLDDTACVAGNTRVSTPGGLRTVEELYQSQQSGESVHVTTDLHSEHDHRRIASHRRAWVTRVGQKPVFKVSLSDGRRVRATGDHRFLTEGGWKRVDEMQAGIDRIQLRHSGNVVAFDSDESEVARWRMLGWMSGDGVFSQGNVALVFGAHEAATAAGMETDFNNLIEDARAWRDVAAPEMVLAGAEKVRPNSGCPRASEGRIVSRSCHIGAQANGVLQITSKSQSLVSYLQEWYGFAQGTAIHKDVPQALHRVADDLKVAYLQGLFSADGCIRHDARGKNEEVMLASSSPAMLRSVQLLLTDLGIISRIGWTHPSGRANPQGQLHVYNQQARAFLALVGFPCSQSKQHRAQEILSRPFAGAAKNPRPAKVLAIEPDGTETVYDITEPVTHSFIAEGLVTHNCNLASMNLMKFRTEGGEFDAEMFVHASEIFITAQEIIVSNASYPTEKIAKNSEDYRPLGLGFANLGALLMAQGLAYDSDEGRAIAGAITAIMTGAAYRQSAKIAANIGTFNGYAKNREPMLRVIGKHRDAVNRIDSGKVPADVLNAARRVWDEALLLGQKHGYRNAQATVLAPTGTIAFMMDCDTTGIEPDIALVKYKKLVGGGLLKIVNQTVPEALQKLGYTPATADSIVEHIDKNDTIEGAPGLQDEHLSVFDCAFKAMNGTRSIHYMGHVKMMAAAQPFISGAISKTVNVPSEASVDEIMQAYIESWKLGLKAVAIYRDGSKRTQPLSTSTDAMKATAKEAPRALRRKLSDERQAITHKFSIAGQEGYFTVGLYEDGSPGEIFIKMSKEGSTISGLMDSFAVAVSMSLQYGVPLSVLVKKFTHTRFEPSGYTTNKEIPIAKSLMDYIFRWFDLKFHPNGDNGHVGKEGHASVAPSSAQAALPETGGSGDDDLNNHLAHLQTDAPPCSECGTIMIRAGACYKCPNCGTTSGCG